VLIRPTSSSGNLEFLDTVTIVVNRAIRYNTRSWFIMSLPVNPPVSPPPSQPQLIYPKYQVNHAANCHNSHHQTIKAKWHNQISSFLGDDGVLHCLTRMGTEQTGRTQDEKKGRRAHSPRSKVSYRYFFLGLVVLLGCTRTTYTYSGTVLYTVLIRVAISENNERSGVSGRVQ
jgi:hypothetical protein